MNAGRTRRPASRTGGSDEARNPFDLSGIAFSFDCARAGRRKRLLRVDGVIPKGTRDTIVGFMIVGGKKYYVQLRAFLHEAADIRIEPGCKLEKYPP